jgi:TIR domain
MGSIRHSILQSKIHELHESRERLTKRLAVLQPARERETRPEEQLRLDHFVAETQAARQQVETELLQLEDELNGLLASPLAGGQGHVPAAPGVTPPTRRLTPGPITVFYSYSHKDEELRQRLETHLKLLKRQGIIADWHDRRISAGTEWEGQINHYLESAHLILLLISADFLASDYCYDKEMQRALERHEAGEARVVPIILRSVDLTGAPFSKLLMLPKDAKPVDTWPNQEAAFTNIAFGIRQVAGEWVHSHFSTFQRI